MVRPKKSRSVDFSLVSFGLNPAATSFPVSRLSVTQTLANTILFITMAENVTGYTAIIAFVSNVAATLQTGISFKSFLIQFNDNRLWCWRH